MYFQCIQVQIIEGLIQDRLLVWGISPEGRIVFFSPPFQGESPIYHFVPMHNWAQKRNYGKGRAQ